MRSSRSQTRTQNSAAGLRAEPDLPPELTADAAWCESVIRQHSGSFYQAFRRLPRGRAAAVYAVYAFCRLLDDSVDEAHDQTELERLAGQFEAFMAGDTPDGPLWRLLRWSFDTFHLEPEPFRSMIEGQRRDFCFQQPETDEDLREYCYLVAGTVGLMLLPLLANPVTAQHRQLAVELGQAMQMTNILRDLAADYRAGRIYLPRQELVRRGIEPADLGREQPSSALKTYWLELARETLNRYQTVRRNLKLFDNKARLPVLLSLLYYSHITLIGIKNPDHILSRRIVVPDLVKFWLYIKARISVWT